MAGCGPEPSVTVLPPVTGARAADDEARLTVSVRFRGAEARILQQQRPRGEDGSDNTGWQVWECSNLALRYIGDDASLAGLLVGERGWEGAGPPPSPAEGGGAGDSSPPFSSLRILDLSSGAGLIALACAAAGASVWASDIVPQLPQLLHNARRNGVLLATDDDDHHPGGCGLLRVLPYAWGEAVSSLRPRAPVSSVRRDTAAGASGEEEAGGLFPWYDVCVASDILFIALRDGFAPHLAATLRGLCLVCRSVLFAFEERLIPEETAFMEALERAAEGEDFVRLAVEAAGGLGAGSTFAGVASADGCESGSAAAPSVAVLRGLHVREIKGPATVISKDEALQGVGGFRDTDFGDMFWEPPPVRIFELRHRRGSGSR
jgi:hypothetical protein